MIVFLPDRARNIAVLRGKEFKPVITDVERGNSITITWKSVDTSTYRVESSTDSYDYIETNMYVAKTISLENVPYAKVLNADLRIKMSTPIGDNSFRKGILEVGLEF